MHSRGHTHFSPYCFGQDFPQKRPVILSVRCESTHSAMTKLVQDTTHHITIPPEMKNTFVTNPSICLWTSAHHRATGKCGTQCATDTSTARPSPKTHHKRVCVWIFALSDRWCTTGQHPKRTVMCVCCRTDYAIVRARIYWVCVCVCVYAQSVPKVTYECKRRLLYFVAIRESGPNTISLFGKPCDVNKRVVISRGHLGRCKRTHSHSLS